MKQRVLDDPTLEPFTRAVLARIDPDVLASLTEHQFRSIMEAVDKARPIKRHTIDIRGTVPLGLARWYFVLLAGRDRRADTVDGEAKLRRWLMNILGSLLLALFLLLPISAIVLLLGYALKSFMGVDLITDAHLMDMIR